MSVAAVSVADVKRGRAAKSANDAAAGPKAPARRAALKGVDAAAVADVEEPRRARRRKSA